MWPSKAPGLPTHWKVKLLVLTQQICVASMTQLVLNLEVTIFFSEARESMTFSCYTGSAWQE